MGSEPSEEAVTNFVNFTSTSREQAVKFLKANDLNSQKAINAYFEDPTGPQTKESEYYDPQTHSYREYNDDGPRCKNFPEAPSRPPSRMNMRDSDAVTGYETAPASASTANTGQKGMSLAEREERELQQAMAMSLNQDVGPQETGVTSTSQPQFTRATRDDYNDNEWAVALLNPSAREIIISPDPEDRKKINGEPAFLRPSREGLYLGGLLTILHSIPLAREALLLRGHTLSNYGHDTQWWNGQPIHLPKVVTVNDTGGMENSDWDDIILESQRLMAFLDSTERAFGSVDPLTSLKSVSYDSEGSVGMFLDNWQQAAVKAGPENQLSRIFLSRAFKRPLSALDTPIDKEFVTLEPFVDPDHGQTLYDVLDRTMWADRPDEELDDVWLDRVADVLTIKLEASEVTAKSIDVKVPSVFYTDRYMHSCRDLTREFRTKRLQLYEEVSKLDVLMGRFSVSRIVAQKGFTSREALEKAAASIPSALPKTSVRDGSSPVLESELTDTDGQRLSNQLKEISCRIEEKLRELEQRKSKALEALRDYSTFLTQPPSPPAEIPHHEYTLRGVCTEPHVTYVLRRADPGDSGNTKSIAGTDWQWWRISFSTDDAKTQRAEKIKRNPDHAQHAAAHDADVVGYTAHKVREIEVLRAARNESRTVLLVYASKQAVSAPEEAAPAPLQAFVNQDNAAFEAEFGNDRNSQDTERQSSDQPHQDSNDPSAVTAMDIDAEDRKGRVSFLEKEDTPHQEMREMQEKAGSTLFNQGRATPTAVIEPPPSYTDSWDS